MQIGETRECGALRIHRFRESIELTDLTHAGKRGQKVRRVSVETSYRVLLEQGSERVLLTDEEQQAYLGNLCLRLEDYTSLAQAVGSLRDYLYDYPDNLKLSESNPRGVDVAPAGFKTSVVVGPAVRVRLGFREFAVSCLRDRNNEPALCQDGVRSVQEFATWLERHRAAIAHGMTFDEVATSLRTAGVEHHRFCRND